MLKAQSSLESHWYLVCVGRLKTLDLRSAEGGGSSDGYTLEETRVRHMVFFSDLSVCGPPTGKVFPL